MMVEQADAISEQDVKQKVEDFFLRQDPLFTDYAESTGFSFKRGDGWAIDMETGEAIYDPSFFSERGYTEAQALFAAIHELEHFADRKKLFAIKDGKEIFEFEMQSRKRHPGRRILGNIVNDMHDNTAVLSTFPALEDSARNLYRDKLFAEANFTELPRHLQFAYTLLREVMLPDEICQINPEVRDVVNRLKAVQDKRGIVHDIISIVANERTDPKTKWRLLHKYIDPEFQRLLEQDIEDEEKKKEQEGGDQVDDGPDEQQDNDGGGSNQDEMFDEYYRDYDEKFPELFDETEIETAVKKSIEEENDNIAERINKGYIAEHGVSLDDIREYRDEYKKIEKYIEPLREVMAEIVADRSVPSRTLSKVGEFGVMLAPGLEAQAIMDAESGVNSYTLVDYEGQETIEPVVGSLRFRLVADLSTSMDGSKQEMQRRVVLLLLEALNEMMSLLTENQGQLSYDLDIKSQVVTFGSPEITKIVKQLSTELTEQQRVAAFKGVSSLSGSTPDYDALKLIEDEMNLEQTNDTEYNQKLIDGKIKEIIVVLTDGGSDSPELLKQKLNSLRGKGVKVLAIGITSSSNSVLTNYAPEAQVCTDLDRLPIVFQNLIKNVFNDLFVHRKIN